MGSSEEKECNVEEEIMEWFEEKGIKMGYPEEVVNDYESRKREELCDECRLSMRDINKSSLFERRNKK